MDAFGLDMDPMPAGPDNHGVDARSYGGSGQFHQNDDRSHGGGVDARSYQSGAQSYLGKDQLYGSGVDTRSYKGGAQSLQGDDQSYGDESSAWGGRGGDGGDNDTYAPHTIGTGYSSARHEQVMHNRHDAPQSKVATAAMAHPLSSQGVRSLPAGTIQGHGRGQGGGGGGLIY